jgi:hypothetical protein
MKADACFRVMATRLGPLAFNGKRKLATESTRESFASPIPLSRRQMGPNGQSAQPTNGYASRRLCTPLSGPAYGEVRGLAGRSSVSPASFAADGFLLVLPAVARDRSVPAR